MAHCSFAQIHLEAPDAWARHDAQSGRAPPAPVLHVAPRLGRHVQQPAGGCGCDPCSQGRWRRFAAAAASASQAPAPPSELDPMTSGWPLACCNFSVFTGSCQAGKAGPRVLRPRPLPVASAYGRRTRLPLGLWVSGAPGPDVVVNFKLCFGVDHGGAQVAMRPRRRGRVADSVGGLPEPPRATCVTIRQSPRYNRIVVT